MAIMGIVLKIPMGILTSFRHLAYQNGSTTYILKFVKKTFVKNYPHTNKTYKYGDLTGALKVIKNGVAVYDDLPTLKPKLI